MDNLKSKLEKGAVLKIETPGQSFYCTSVYNASGIARMFQYTAKDISQPLLVCVDNRLDVLNLSAEFFENAYHLTSKYWPGSLNIILRGNGSTSELLGAGSHYIMFNMPASREFRCIIFEAQMPLAVCACEDKAEYCPDDIEKIELNEEVIMNGSVVSFIDEQKPVLVSEQTASAAEIQEIVSPLLKADMQPEEYWAVLAAKNSLSTPFFVAEKGYLTIDKQAGSGNIGFITFGPHEEFSSDTVHVKTLSGNGDMCEAAVNFFSAIREMDQKGFDSIIMETLPENDLGIKINAQLKRMGMDLANFALLMNENN